MRIDSGLQGYYYDQGRFRRPDMDTDEPAPQAQPQQTRTPGFSPLVESSTVLSNSLSNALWALETGDVGSRVAAPGPAPMPGATDEESADKVRQLYLEFTGDQG
ncbi:hypothetical protein [Gellertiella hungarica]|uniref:Uncharacterized protein n=1 Tax=Gellertiella hungarica TaxID=1572859 RepID=A0A7W6J2G6_9HYPH|nr:hypothetical protein [Gellertiella hungarica]MBB4063507.1 hypothetical protein [Gellertiella hungarica]